MTQTRPKRASGPPSRDGARLSRALVRRLAAFRYQLRRFLRFSEKAARAAGVTPQQHQLLLGVAGYTGRGWATVGELAEFLQERHNAVVGLVERAARRRLVGKTPDAADRRVVRVSLTARGEAVLARLSRLHRDEAAELAAQMLAAAATPRRTGGTARTKNRVRRGIA
ncbi:MAG TPA: MarR family transcriptional regulator [Terriglobia bacterium]|nr:MarR family transcriptional regulator [Terriglobia bacterium]